MSIEHISDNDIQIYLDNGEIDKKVQAHIAKCDSCSILLKEYQSCFALLEKEDSPKLSESFVKNTMLAVKQEQIIKDSKLAFYLYTFSGIVSILLVAQYYLKFKIDFSNISMQLFTNIFSDWSIITSIINLYNSAPGIVSTLIFAGITLLFYSVIDKLVQKAQPGKLNCLSI